MISDAIYQALTGIAGDFSGRIAYVLRKSGNPAQRYTLQVDTDGEQPKTVLSSRDPILSPAWTQMQRKSLTFLLKPNVLQSIFRTWLQDSVKF